VRERLVATTTVLWLLAGCKADLPQLTSDGSIETECSPFADLLVTFTPAGETGSSSDGERALGPPDGEVVAIDTDSVLVVAFVGLGGVIDEEGDDILVHGSASEDGLAATYVSDDNQSFQYAGDLDADGLTIDLATATATVALYVRIVGITGVVSVDAVEALQTTCGSATGR
jgi:hypothetical protein